MGQKDPRVDAYIAKAEPFARPILKRLRALMHKAVPDVTETMKWSFPHFEYKGLMCSMASFKGHCAFGFWKGSLVLGNKAQRDAMGHLGRIESLDDLPSDRTLTAYIKKAAKLNDEGVKVARVVKSRPKVAAIPVDFAAALGKNRKAREAFEAFSPSHRREYIEWIAEAKGDETRRRRLATALDGSRTGSPATGSTCVVRPPRRFPSLASLAADAAPPITVV